MRCDVIIVLAGGITPDGSLPESVKRRVEVALFLYKKGVAPRVIFSGQWSLYWKMRPPVSTEAQLMKEYAYSLGMPRKAVIKEEHSHNTYQNLFYSFKIFLEPNRWKRVVIITSDFHAWRVRKMASEVMPLHYIIDVIGVQSPGSFWKKVRRSAKERFASSTQRFFQYLLHRG